MTNWWLAMLITYLDLMPVIQLLLHLAPALGKLKFTGFYPRFGGVTAVTGDTVCSQHDKAADLLRSGSDAMMKMNASKVSNWFPLRRRLFGPSAEEGVRVQHVEMTRRETSSAREYVTCYQPPFLPVFTKSGHIIAPENNNTLGFLNRRERPK